MSAFMFAEVFPCTASAMVAGSWCGQHGSQMSRDQESCCRRLQIAIRSGKGAKRFSLYRLCTSAFTHAPNLAAWSQLRLLGYCFPTVAKWLLYISLVQDQHVLQP